MKRLSVDCTTLRALALTTPPTALESLDDGLTPNRRLQKRWSRFERAFLYIFSLKVRLALPRVLWARLNHRVLSARVESALKCSAIKTLPSSAHLHSFDTYGTVRTVELKCEMWTERLAPFFLWLLQGLKWKRKKKFRPSHGLKISVVSHLRKNYKSHRGKW